MKNDRLFQLLYLLLEHGSMTAPDLASRLEVSVRTIYRDVDTLSYAGVPIYALAGKGGGISLLESYRFDRTLLSDEEQNQLLFAIQSLQATDLPVGDLMHKLGTVFQKQRSDWIAVDFSRWGMKRTDTERFELLKSAILGKQVLRITYCGTSGDKTERNLHPLRLVYKDKHWYLQGYCLKAQDFRLFKVGRILELELTGELFLEDYTEDIPPLEAELKPGYGTHLKLRFSEQVAFRVYDEFDHSIVVEEPEGTLLLEVDFPMDSWTVGYLFSFGTEVEILEPVSLKKELADYANKIASHYKT